jgi:hypothetical protein
MNSFSSAVTVGRPSEIFLGFLRAGFFAAGFLAAFFAGFFVGDFFLAMVSPGGCEKKKDEAVLRPSRQNSVRIVLEALPR